MYTWSIFTLIFLLFLRTWLCIIVVQFGLYGVDPFDPSSHLRTLARVSCPSLYNNQSISVRLCIYSTVEYLLHVLRSVKRVSLILLINEPCGHEWIPSLEWLAAARRSWTWRSMERASSSSSLAGKRRVTASGTWMMNMT